MAPDFERLARTPCPLASLASSGMSTLSSALAFSCCRNAVRVWRKSPANSAHELDELISTTRTASMRGRGGSNAEQTRRLSALNAAPELLLGREQEVLVERIGRDRDLDPFTAARDDREHGGRGVRQPTCCVEAAACVSRPRLPRRTTTAA